MDMTAEPRTEIRRRIIHRLRQPDWMNSHFAVAAHASDVADAVLEALNDLLPALLPPEQRACRSNTAAESQSVEDIHRSRTASEEQS